MPKPQCQIFQGYDNYVQKYWTAQRKKASKKSASSTINWMDLALCTEKNPLEKYRFNGKRFSLLAFQSATATSVVVDQRGNVEKK